MVARIKQEDTVMVISGRDKGKTGTVIEIVLKKDQALVKGVAMVTKHAKPRRQGETGGIRKKESFIELSSLMPVCGACGKPCRVGGKTISDGKHVRVCTRCKAVF